LVGRIQPPDEVCICEPGVMTACYTGPAGTEDVGICHGGMQTCNADGFGYGPCLDQQVPGAETCDAAGANEDCDSDVNEGCVCGDGIIFAGETCDDGGTSDADACSSTCQTQEVLQLAAGRAHTCALLTGGVVKCWGDNGGGQLGLDDSQDRGDQPNEMGDNLPAVSLGTGKTAVAISAENEHTCALLNNASVKCWGYNEYGQLGLGNTQAHGDGANEMGDNLPAVILGTGKTAVAISSAHYHTCALLNDASVKCWGHNFYGQLGLGDFQNRGDGANEMGDNLPAVSLGTGKTAVAISSGYNHTCALLNDASVKCWGHNGYGQLGLGNTQHRGAGANDMGDNLPTVSLGTGKTAVAISAGDIHTCALLDDASVKCWGYNGFGGLGLGDNADRGDGANEMGDNLPAVSLGTGKTAVAISAGGYHTCALLNDASAKCWGYNQLGGLGLGDTAHRGDEPNEVGDNLPVVDLGTGKTGVAISAGDYQTCALLNDASVKCWGYNELGGLGLGDTQHRGDEPNQMGDNLPTVKLFSALW